MGTRPSSQDQDQDLDRIILVWDRSCNKIKVSDHITARHVCGVRLCRSLDIAVPHTGRRRYNTGVLLDRPHTTGRVYNGQLSVTQTVMCGVLQGSVIGPLLYVLYTAELSEVITRHGLNVHQYAADTQLYLNVLSNDATVAMHGTSERVPRRR